MPTTKSLLDTEQTNGVSFPPLPEPLPPPPSANVPLARVETDGLAFERLASDPNVDVAKLERLMALWERGQAQKAEQAFNSAMADAQAEMRPIATDATNPQTHSRYASYEALDRALRPIYTTHGFALSFNTGEAPDDYVGVRCKVTHRAGHAELYKLDMPADGKGAKGGDVMTKTHAAGSALSYGQRYLLKMIFNVAVGEGDDDGNATNARKGPEPPAGYELWLDELTAVGDEGTPALKAMWDSSKIEFREFLTKHASKTWAHIKTKAAKVKAS